MAVGVEREADLALSQRLRHDARVNSVHQQEGRASVAEIVDSDHGKIRFQQDRVETSADVALIERRPDGGREHQWDGSRFAMSMTRLIVLDRGSRDTPRHATPTSGSLLTSPSPGRSG